METILSQNIQFSVSTFCITIIGSLIFFLLLEVIRKLIFRNETELKRKYENLEVLQKDFEKQVSDKANEITLEIENEKDSYIYKLSLIESLLNIIASLSKHTPEHQMKLDYYKRSKSIAEMSNGEFEFMIDDIIGLIYYHDTINADRLEKQHLEPIISKKRKKYYAFYRIVNKNKYLISRFSIRENDHNYEIIKKIENRLAMISYSETSPYLVTTELNDDILKSTFFIDENSFKEFLIQAIGIYGEGIVGLLKADEAHLLNR